MSNFNDYNNYDNRGSRRGGNAVVLISVALVMLMLGALIGVVIYQGVDKQDQAVLGSEVTTQQPTQEPTPEPTAQPTPEVTPEPAVQTQQPSGTATTTLAAFSNQIADVVADAQNSVVGIHNYQMVTVNNMNSYSGGWPFYFYYGGGQNDKNDQQPEQVEQLAGSGSGIIYSSDGYVITNYHVVQNASRVTVLLGEEEIDAKVVGYDAVQDIALLKIDRTGLPAAKMGDSSAVRTGEFVIAIGSPLGDELAGTTTFGMVSYANRTLDVNGALVTMIQTDAAINSGNSGGALLNVNGEVIGINSRKTSGSTTSGATIEGIGFAIPINEVRATVDELIATGKITRPGLGITGQEVSGYYNMVPSGIMVATVTEGSPADQAGMKVQDIIIAVDGKDVTTFSELRAALYSHKIGDTITVTVFRESQSIDLTVTLAELKQD